MVGKRQLSTSTGKVEEKKLQGLYQLPGKLLEDDDLEGACWFDCAPEWPESGEGGIRGSIEMWREAAGEALSGMSRLYDKQTASKGRKSVEKLLNREKTVADKIAAATLVVQESPLHRLDELFTLFSFVKKKGRRERSPAIDAFKDLLINDLLPDERLLVGFEERDFECAPQAITKRHLCYALFEDELKKMCSDFLDVIDECGKDSVEHFKLKSVSVLFDLLAAKPENEKELLSMLVNKLGDPVRKVASNASFYLRQLVEKHHPQMKTVLLNEVEQLIFRANVGRRTQYYAVSFLNQLRFSKEDVELARRLVTVYMNIVTVCIESDKDSKKLKNEGGLESQESRIMGAVLTGVNRAFPYTDPETFDPSLGSHFDSLFRIAHAKSIASATQALAFLLQISKSNSTISDRFYRALYSRVGDLAQAGESRQPLLLSVILKSMKADVSTKRVKAFAKRLLQTASRSSSSLAGAILVLLSEVLNTTHTGLLKSFVSAEAHEDEEVFRDIVSDGEGDDEDEEKKSGSKQTPDSEARSGEGKQDDKAQSAYDISAREPLYARAERSALWELIALTCHYHPSISKFATALCAAEERIVYPSDPLTDFTLTAFLDKFSYKKPKKRLTDSLHGKRAVRASEALTLKSNNFLETVRKGEEEEEDAFFGKFFQLNPGKLDTLQNAGTADEDGNAELMSDSGSEEEAFQTAMHAEMRRLGGGDIPITESGDVDEDDADELAAFADAFKDEIMDDDDDNDDEDGVDDMEGLSAEPRNSKKRSSVFAAAEDYAEAIASVEQETPVEASKRPTKVRKRQGRRRKQNGKSKRKK